MLKKIRFTCVMEAFFDFNDPITSEVEQLGKSYSKPSKKYLNEAAEIIADDINAEIIEQRWVNEPPQIVMDSIKRVKIVD